MAHARRIRAVSNRKRHQRDPTVQQFLLTAPSLLFASVAQAADKPKAASRALVPRTSFEGPTLHFDFPSTQIGIAEYEEGLFWRRSSDR
jgi:hypothetical protein